MQSWRVKKMLPNLKELKLSEEVKIQINNIAVVRHSYFRNKWKNAKSREKLSVGRNKISTSSYYLGKMNEISQFTGIKV